MAHINTSGLMDNQLGVLQRIQTARVVVTSAQLKSGFTTPVPILPTPPGNLNGSGFYKVYVISVTTTPGSVNYTAGGAITFVYHGGSVNPHQGNIPAATITSGTATNTILPPPSADVVAPLTTGIDLTIATANFATGNGTITVVVDFVLQSIGPTVFI